MISANASPLLEDQELPECESFGCPDPQSRRDICEQCRCVFCNECWDKQPTHRPGKLAQDGGKHVRSNPKVTRLLERIFEGPRGVHGEAEHEFEEDSSTLWFGHSLGEGGDEAQFHDYRRFVFLMQACSQGSKATKYPHLVTFVGDTGKVPFSSFSLSCVVDTRAGDGKSTLIKTLIQLSLLDRPQEILLTTPTPVVGSAEDNRPTTSSVHLYSDPQTAGETWPIFFADCEGFRGGEGAPATEDERTAQRSNIYSWSPKADDFAPMGLKYEMTKALKCKTRKIAWATTPDMKKREFAVTQLYPRLLYTFSDCVVFVLRNLRSFEPVLLQMISWGDQSLEGSLNQPVLPHAIIASNCTDAGISDDQWDVPSATNTIINQFQHIRETAKIRELEQKWAERGIVINSLQDLIHRYYSSIQVVRIPTKGRYMKIEEQVQKLRKTIAGNCKKAFEKRDRARLVFHAEAFKTYLEAAFEHFSNDLNTPFDFLSVAIRLTPISLDWSHNIVRLAHIVLSETDHNRGLRSGPAWIFARLAKLIASYIFLDIVRKGLPGQPDRAFQSQYLKPCDQALERFLTQFWPCSFRTAGFTCINAQTSHTKGHQSINGRIFAPGGYECERPFEEYIPEWHDRIRAELIAISTVNSEAVDLESDPSSSSLDPRSADIFRTYEVHQRSIRTFHSMHRSALRLRSTTACLSCLTEFPAHALPCSHMLCTQCVRAWGKDLVSNDFPILSCPFEGPQTQFEGCHVHLIPPLASTRILSLEGEGARVLNELLVLRALSEHLPNIRIQRFFDLIVGTGTAGFLALGLAVRDWSLADALDQFTQFCTAVYSRREGSSSLPLLSRSSLYDTQILKDTLQDILGDSTLFGGLLNGRTASTRVAVIGTDVTGQRPVIFSNYNRPHEVETSTTPLFFRPEMSEDEISICGAAHATLAIPLYFKPFIHRSGAAYYAGAVRQTNPAVLAEGERKALWPEIAVRSPDLFLTLGSGEDSKTDAEIEAHIRQHTVHQPLPLIDIGFVNKKRLGRALHFKAVQKQFELLKNRINSPVSAALTWAQLNSIWNFLGVAADRHHRVTVNQPELPSIDDFNGSKQLVESVKDVIRREHDAKLEDIAHRLVASNFYFERTYRGRADATANGYISRGYLRCRFRNGAEDLRHLAYWLRDRYGSRSFNYPPSDESNDFQPYFSISSGIDNEVQHQVVLTLDYINRMLDQVEFELPEISIDIQEEEDMVDIALHTRDTAQFSISGFPRPLIANLTDSLSSDEEDIADLPFVVIPGENSPLLQSPSSIDRLTTKPFRSAGFWNETIFKITSRLRGNGTDHQSLESIDSPEGEPTIPWPVSDGVPIGTDEPQLAELDALHSASASSIRPNPFARDYFGKSTTQLVDSMESLSLLARPLPPLPDISPSELGTMSELMSKEVYEMSGEKATKVFMHTNGSYANSPALPLQKSSLPPMHQQLLSLLPPLWETLHKQDDPFSRDVAENVATSLVAQFDRSTDAGSIQKLPSQPFRVHSPPSSLVPAEIQRPSPQQKPAVTSTSEWCGAARMVSGASAMSDRDGNVSPDFSDHDDPTSVLQSAQRIKITRVQGHAEEGVINDTDPDMNSNRGSKTEEPAGRALSAAKPESAQQSPRSCTKTGKFTKTYSSTSGSSQMMKACDLERPNSPPLWLDTPRGGRGISTRFRYRDSTYTDERISSSGTRALEGSDTPSSHHSVLRPDAYDEQLDGLLRRLQNRVRPFSVSSGSGSIPLQLGSPLIYEAESDNGQSGNSQRTSCIPQPLMVGGRRELDATGHGTVSGNDDEGASDTCSIHSEDRFHAWWQEQSRGSITGSQQRESKKRPSTSQGRSLETSQLPLLSSAVFEGFQK